jgi:quercetin dioxygenase-like cupin family protein
MLSSEKSSGTKEASPVRKIACFALCSLFVIFCLQAEGQPVAGGACRPVSERMQDVGCWILSNDPVGELAATQTFWHLDTFATRDAAEAAKTKRSTIVQALGKTWLLTIEDATWRASGGEHVTTIGPLPITPGVYATQYMEAVFNPGMTAQAHTHSGPEAWYTVAGETCLETPDGKQVGRAGGPPVIIPGGPPMHLTATGTEVRRSLVLILHDAGKPATTLHHDWTPKGLCKNN